MITALKSLQQASMILTPHSKLLLLASEEDQASVYNQLKDSSLGHPTVITCLTTLNKVGHHSFFGVKLNVCFVNESIGQK